MQKGNKGSASKGEATRGELAKGEGKKGKAKGEGKKGHAKGEGKLGEAKRTSAEIKYLRQLSKSVKELAEAEEGHFENVAEGHDEAMELRRSTNSWAETISPMRSVIEDRAMHIRSLAHEVVRGMINKLHSFEPQGDPAWLLRGLQDDATGGELMMRRFYSADVEANKIRVEVQMGLSVLCFEACHRRLEGIDCKYVRRVQLSGFCMLKDIEDEQLVGEERCHFGLFQWATPERLKQLLGGRLRIVPAV